MTADIQWSQAQYVNPAIIRQLRSVYKKLIYPCEKEYLYAAGGWEDDEKQGGGG